MSFITLFRKNYEAFGDDIKEEFDICVKNIKTVEYRTQVPKNSLVVGRYSVLPFYQELENELKRNGSFLINSYKMHRYIADINNYYEDLKDFTPKTYKEWFNIPEGQYVVKGVTNGRKHQWNTHMYAKDKASLQDVIKRVFDDSFISNQGVVVREYIPLKQFDEGINGLPITNEWRFFFYKNELLTHGYYWSSFPEVEEKATCNQDMIDFAKNIASIVSKKVNFFVVDVAEKADGGYVLIELNDGQMSGLSLCPIDQLYLKLNECLTLDNSYTSWF